MIELTKKKRSVFFRLNWKQSVEKFVFFPWKTEWLYSFHWANFVPSLSQCFRSLLIPLLPFIYSLFHTCLALFSAKWLLTPLKFCVNWHSVMASIILNTYFIELSGFRYLIKDKVRVEFPLYWPCKQIGQSANLLTILYMSTIIGCSIVKRKT